jgi:hypothetical protein
MITDYEHQPIRWTRQDGTSGDGEFATTGPLLLACTWVDFGRSSHPRRMVGSAVGGGAVKERGDEALPGSKSLLPPNPFKRRYRSRIGSRRGR